MAVQRNDTWRAMVAALVVATGLAVVWAMLGAWLMAIIEPFDSSDAYENIYVAADGTPVIGTESQALYQNVTVSRRTLDGQPWPVDYEYWLRPSSLAPFAYPPQVVRLPLQWHWGGRIGGFTDGRNPPASWYVVRDDQPTSHCYFAGFDAFSKLPVGFIGRNGFRATKPELDEQFALPGTYGRQLAPFLASTQYFQIWGLVQFHSINPQQHDSPQWLVHVAEADEVWEVDLRKRSARVAYEVPGIVSVSRLLALEKTAKSTGDAAALPAASPQAAPAESEAEKSRKKEPETVSVLSVRTKDKLDVYTPSGERREFVLPQEVPNQQLSVYWIAPNQLLLEFNDGHWSGGHIEHLFWIDASGKIQKDVQVKLAGRPAESPRATAWVYCGSIPVSIVFLIGVVLGAPLVMVQNYASPTYQAAVATGFGVAWPPLIVVLGVAVVLTWFILRLQRKYRRPATGRWAVFVFLLGLPGFLAYLVEQHRAKLEACSQCGEIVPRDREECAACAKEFAAPLPVGTEIFA